jgi:hypothetical protein
MISWIATKWNSFWDWMNRGDALGYRVELHYPTPYEKYPKR